MMNHPNRSSQYVCCSGCGCSVLEIHAVYAGLDPETEELIFLCEDCDDLGIAGVEEQNSIRWQGDSCHLQRRKEQP